MIAFAGPNDALMAVGRDGITNPGARPLGAARLPSPIAVSSSRIPVLTTRDSVWLPLENVGADGYAFAVVDRASGVVTRIPFPTERIDWDKSITKPNGGGFLPPGAVSVVFVSFEALLQSNDGDVWVVTDGESAPGSNHNSALYRYHMAP